jgi:hypothetical protein
MPVGELSFSCPPPQRSQRNRRRTACAGFPSRSVDAAAGPRSPPSVGEPAGWLCTVDARLQRAEPLITRRFAVARGAEARPLDGDHAGCVPGISRCVRPASRSTLDRNWAMHLRATHDVRCKGGSGLAARSEGVSLPRPDQPFAEGLFLRRPLAHCPPTHISLHAARLPHPQPPSHPRPVGRRNGLKMKGTPQLCASELDGPPASSQPEQSSPEHSPGPARALPQHQRPRQRHMLPRLCH